MGGRVFAAVARWLDFDPAEHRADAARDVSPLGGPPPELQRLNDDVEHEAWLRSMTDPQTPEDVERARLGELRLRAALREQALRDGDAGLRGITDGGAT